MNIRTLLVDDHAIVREGVSLLLEAEGDVSVVGQASDGEEALRAVREKDPDVVVMDISMPRMNGIEAIRKLRAGAAEVPVVVLSMYATTEHVYRAFQGGANGYVLKECAGRELIQAMRTVTEGQYYISNKISGTLIEDYLKHRADSKSPIDRLTAREREVLQLVAEGWPNVRIAEKTGLTRKTVETYRSRIMRKLEIKTMPEMIRFALQNGFTVE